MIEVKTLENIERLLIGEKPIIQKIGSAGIFDENQNLIPFIKEDFYYSRVLGNKFFFQVGNENNLNVFNNGQLYNKSGLWGLITAFPIESNLFYIFRQEEGSPPKFLIINDQLETISEGPKGCNYGTSKYLFRRGGNRIICFELESNKEMWEKEFEEVLTNVAHISALSILLILLQSGHLISLDISSGELKWKQELAGRVQIFENKIYCITNYSIKELDAKTGQIIREESMQNLVESYHFRPTGEHKVYDEYIFSMSSGKPGRVAIYDRKSLEFLELIEIDEMIPVGQDHLHWHDNRLYILDFTKNLHIFEKE